MAMALVLSSDESETEYLSCNEDWDIEEMLRESKKKEKRELEADFTNKLEDMKQQLEEEQRQKLETDWKMMWRSS